VGESRPWREGESTEGAPMRRHLASSSVSSRIRTSPTAASTSWPASAPRGSAPPSRTVSTQSTTSRPGLRRRRHCALQR
jgi:hypothetical protein